MNLHLSRNSTHLHGLPSMTINYGGNNAVNGASTWWMQRHVLKAKLILWCLSFWNFLFRTKRWYATIKAWRDEKLKQRGHIWMQRACHNKVITNPHNTAALSQLLGTPDQTIISHVEGLCILFIWYLMQKLSITNHFHEELFGRIQNFKELSTCKWRCKLLSVECLRSYMLRAPGGQSPDCGM